MVGFKIFGLLIIIILIMFIFGVILFIVWYFKGMFIKDVLWIVYLLILWLVV